MVSSRFFQKQSYNFIVMEGKNIFNKLGGDLARFKDQGSGLAGGLLHRLGGLRARGA